MVGWNLYDNIPKWLICVTLSLKSTPFSRHIRCFTSCRVSEAAADGRLERALKRATQDFYPSVVRLGCLDDWINLEES